MIHFVLLGSVLLVAHADIENLQNEESEVGYNRYWLPDLPTITKMVYQSGTEVGSGTYTTSVEVAYSTSYRVKFEILQNDLGDPSEYVTSAKVNGRNILKNGRCDPPGGDYDCTFFDCEIEGMETFQNHYDNKWELSISLTGHSHDCDCHPNDDPMLWVCLQQDLEVPWMAALGFQPEPMVAVGRFTLIPVGIRGTASESDVASMEADNRKLKAANEELLTVLRSLAN